MQPKTGLVLLFIFGSQVNAAVDEKSALDCLLPIFRIFRKVSSDALRDVVESRRSRKLLRQNNKLLELPSNVMFPCNLDIIHRSPEVPKTAHEVRPGDIDVIGALGDSLTAGFGASANSLIELFSENRGKSFSIGGQGTWRKSLTLPNILKMFNPNLIGYSLRTSLTLDKESQFNVAEAGAISINMPYMAKVLVKRIKADPRVNIEKDWKMITIMIGDNDFCTELNYYKNPEIVLDKHKQDLLDVLRTLRDNLPRTIVNVIPPIHLRAITQMTDKPPICELTHTLSCPSVDYAFRSRRKLYFSIMRQWQELDIEVSNYPEFDLDDFTVIPHNFTLDQIVPTKPQGGTDYTYLSVDCFHFSEKGHSLFANYLWNSIMEPFGYKTTKGTGMFQVFRCPSNEHPFIFTRRNSG